MVIFILYNYFFSSLRFSSVLFSFPRFSSLPLFRTCVRACCPPLARRPRALHAHKGAPPARMRRLCRAARAPFPHTCRPPPLRGARARARRSHTARRCPLDAPCAARARTRSSADRRRRQLQDTALRRSRGIANILWALAELCQGGGTADAAWKESPVDRGISSGARLVFLLMAVEALDRVADFQPQELSMVAWACAKFYGRGGRPRRRGGGVGLGGRPEEVAASRRRVSSRRSI